MRITRIKLRGFLNHDDTDLDLSSVRGGILVTGPTGAGKSALLNGFLTVAYGKWPGDRSAAECIKAGNDSCCLHYEFETGGTLYRMILTVSAKSKVPKTDLQFSCKGGNGSWTPLTGKGIDETREKIRQTIGMDFDTLTSGPVSSQDQSGRFCDPPIISETVDGRRLTFSGAQARIQILSRMLNLGRWSEFRGKKSSEARAVDQQAATLEAQVATMDTSLAGRQEAEIALSQAEGSIQAARDGAQEAQGAIERLTGQVGTLQAEIEAGRRQCAGLAADQRALADLAASRHAKEGTLERYRGILDHRGEIETKAGESEALNKQADALRVELAGIEAEIKGIEAQKGPAEARLKAAQKKLAEVQSRLADVHIRLARRREQEAKVTRLASARTDRHLADLRYQGIDAKIIERRRALDAITESNQEAQKKQGEILAEEKRVGAEKEGLEPQIAGHEKRTAVMDKVPCISADGLPQSKWETCPLLQDAQQSIEPLRMLRQQHAARCAWVRPALPEIQPIKDLETLLYNLGKEKQAASLEIRKFDQEISALTPAEAELAALDTLAGELPRLEAEESAGKEDCFSLTEELSGVGIEIDALKGKLCQNNGILFGLEKSIADLVRWVAIVPEIALAERELPRLEADLDSLGGQLVSLTERIEECQIVQAGLAAKENTLEDSHGVLEGQRVKFSRARADEQRLTEAAAHHRDTIARLDKLAEDRTQAAGEAVVLRLRHVNLLALIEAYRQIPLMIIEKMARSMLEEESNRILSRISLNGMRLRIETQKEIKSRDTLADGLEIYVRDIAGERPLALYSGGQHFQINLALRIALAKLQSHRAGARIGTLVIDEGFGTQSAEYLDGIMAALRAVQDEFPLLLVISHVEALRDVFRSRIRVEGDPRGCKAELVTA